MRIAGKHFSRLRRQGTLGGYNLPNNRENPCIVPVAAAGGFGGGGNLCALASGLLKGDVIQMGHEGWGPNFGPQDHEMRARGRLRLRKLEYGKQNFFLKTPRLNDYRLVFVCRRSAFCKLLIPFKRDLLTCFSCPNSEGTPLCPFSSRAALF
ncbi:MAG: hypothetical protein JWQ49_6710 [Edaphobacter sp.]|nr:hypothetical protein [Edaphobacter sp.]